MRRWILPLAMVASAIGCSNEPPGHIGPSSFAVVVLKVNGSDPPTADKPLPANRGDHSEKWDFTIEARNATGDATAFDGYVRLSTKPGAVLAVTGDGAKGRNMLLKGGKASGTVEITAVYGPTRLWVEDIGYTPAPAGQVPACSNGNNDDPDHDVLVDYPADPGCAYADDNSEGGGTFAAGVSAPIQYALPKLSDIQGQAAVSPYPYEAITVKTAPPQHLIVTRVSSDGFYVTDLADATIGYNHLFAFNFSTPAHMRICDRVTYLAGTVNEFFGFTELSFPSFKLEYPIEGQDVCEVPEAAVIFDPDAMPKINVISDDVAMEKVESGLVRAKKLSMPTKFGPGLVVNNSPKADASNCDLNGDGQVDFSSPAEGGCANACEADPECSEWTTFSARSEIKVHNGATLIQIDVSTASDFDPQASKGALLDSVTGTLRNFSGGNLNWTIQTRCPDDLACKGTKGCVDAALPSTQACVRLRTIDDPDQGTN